MLLFFLDPCRKQFLKGMYWKGNIFCWDKSFYLLKLYLNYILFKAKSKPHINFSQKINIIKCKTKGSLLICQELLNLEVLLGFTEDIKVEQIIKAKQCFACQRIYSIYVWLVHYWLEIRSQFSLKISILKWILGDISIRIEIGPIIDILK